ncbi:hypothetical protein [Pelagicoccus sp. SDUM812003]|uniref:hypothetical protein n=1 Tax=Pelagicoccus sp. SDUM812003 TaxID=3041267 RepID=UPI00280F9A09|nr:hypothetical protein [Pelagicoccus sp. SDUM812003]MDQ8202784.1 hypothetical protein [Pelagicoccus sp. SDUM812003]
MAGDWIKIEHATSDKPEVFEMAGILNIDPDAVVGKLLRVWVWFDQHTEEGNAPVTVSALLDRLSGVNGFVSAMAKVGWIETDSERVRLPHFDRHNGQTAKRRALNARRVAKHKQKGNANGNVASVTSALPREEKRREDKERGAKTNNRTSSRSNDSPQKANKARPNSQDEVESFCEDNGLKRSDGEYMFNHWEGNGYRNNGVPIKCWKSVIRSWRTGGFFPSQKANGAAPRLTFNEEAEQRKREREKLELTSEFEKAGPRR